MSCLNLLFQLKYPIPTVALYSSRSWCVFFIVNVFISIFIKKTKTFLTVKWYVCTFKITCSYVMLKCFAIADVAVMNTVNS